MRILKDITCRNCGRRVGELAYDDKLDPAKLDTTVATCSTCTPPLPDEVVLLKKRIETLETDVSVLKAAPKVL